MIKWVILSHCQFLWLWDFYCYQPWKGAISFNWPLPLPTQITVICGSHALLQILVIHCYCDGGDSDAGDGGEGDADDGSGGDADSDAAADDHDDGDNGMMMMLTVVMMVVVMLMMVMLMVVMVVVVVMVMMQLMVMMVTVVMMAVMVMLMVLMMVMVMIIIMVLIIRLKEASVTQLGAGSTHLSTCCVQYSILFSGTAVSSIIPCPQDYCVSY